MAKCKHQRYDVRLRFLTRILLVIVGLYDNSKNPNNIVRVRQEAYYSKSTGQYSEHTDSQRWMLDLLDQRKSSQDVLHGLCDGLWALRC